MEQNLEKHIRQSQCLHLSILWVLFCCKTTLCAVSEDFCHEPGPGNGLCCCLYKKSAYTISGLQITSWILKQHYADCLEDFTKARVKNCWSKLDEVLRKQRKSSSKGLPGYQLAWSAGLVQWVILKAGTSNGASALAVPCLGLTGLAEIFAQ